MLAFFGIAPGMRVAELMAGRGYTAELLARVVGASGEVYGQNNRFALERFAEAPWSARLAKPVMKNVKRVDSELEAPLPDVRDLDAVLMVLFYHDTVWLKTDREAMLRAIFVALKPGGVFGVVDHSARAGDGIKETQTLHRIEQSVVESEIAAAGFVLDASADFLKNPQDPRDWNASPTQAGERRGTSDRFVLRFVKPKP
jgi:predicted methyltransferase